MKRYLLLCLGLLPLIFSCQTAAPTDPPNVILIITDDQGYGDIGAHGAPIVQTPNLDQLYAQSLRLTNYHVGTTCAPTRAGLMTGRNCNRNGVWHTIAGASLLNRREETMADVFAANGYATGMFGKWHLGDNYPFRPHDRGFQEAFYHGGGGVGQTPDYWGNDYFDDTYFRNGVPEQKAGYCTDIWFDEGLKFIEKNQDQPFFCYLSTNAPHSPFNVPEKYRAYYEYENIPNEMKRFFGMISNVDENIGVLMEKLQEWQLAENTILLFTTDNGTARGFNYDRENEEWYGFNAGMRGKKGSQYDGGHRVPMFMRWPRGKWQAGTDFGELTAHVDMLPTLASLCGLDFDPPNKLDGQDISAWLTSDDKPSKRYLITDTQRLIWPQKGKASCVMSTQWRLVNGNELYDIQADPGQENNLADQYPDLVGEMNAFYEEWWTEVEKEFENSPIVLGSEAQNPTFLACHDVIASERVAWNQNMIRRGIYSQGGYYQVEVEQAGNYRFSLYRWPPSSQLTLGMGSPDGQAGTSSTSAVPDGAILPIRSAALKVAGQALAADANPGQAAVSFELPLEAGKTQLEANFLLANGDRMDAYYVEVERIQ